MGLFDWVFGQFIDVIEWTDDSQDTMVYRFPRHNNEIKYGAKLTVRESQMAIFVNEGVIADVLGPGIYELETKNLPVMTSIEHWDHAFNSPFKAEVYFVNTKRFTDLKWGTKNPIMVRDPEFSMVRLRAFGTYEIRITDPKQFMNEIVGTDQHFTIDEIDDQLTNLIISKFTTIVGESKTPILDMASNYEKFSEYISEKISPYFGEYGLSLTKILVENISLPADVEKALDARSSREITGNLDDNIKYQTGQALGSDTGGAMGDMIGMGAGIAMGQNMADSLAKKDVNKHTPPPLPERNETMYFVALNDEKEGPYDIRTIQLFISEKKIQEKTLVWTEGQTDWVEAYTILEKHFNATPPPLPKI
ncbi:MAG: Putative virion core protein (lumpy skin disease virus) [uncultured Sulfurovum sp.]|uniref:Virion core protein (Lumpy skin disease virus) n=1 Tax=uncultured Sulfurovum sp. TaxID=269237 RepID=A0A6S6SK05_9BACT|nr:MAG: Putative virion core protein (lumpy skin disease virus) [uncultured Sulfurovum sp.]